MAKKKLNRIKSGLFDRGLSMTKVALQSGASIAANSLKHALSDQDLKKSSFKALMEVQAKRLAKELGQLKGSLMKVGQMLALYGEHFFPEEVVDALKSLNEDSPPLEWEAVEKILNRRLNTEQLAALDIQVNALAAASMGQVHRAKIKATGEEICLKIQYPGVAKAIDSDVKTLRSLLAMFKLLPSHSKGLESMFKEIRGMLKQEMDYVRELRSTEFMSQALSNKKQYIVPKTYEQFSGPKILATSYCPGSNIDSPEVLALSNARRNSIGHDFAQLFLDELFVHNHVQTDPHFGNYKIKLDEGASDAIILLDFGALRKFPKTFISHYKNLLQGALQQDEELCIKGAKGVGFLKEDDNDELLECFTQLAFLAVEPWLPHDDPRMNQDLLDDNKHYIWSKSDLPNRITKKAAEYALTFKMRPPPREVVFLDRKIGGVFIVLKTLDARFDSWSMINEYLN